MYRKINLFLIAIFITIIGNAQVRTNYNNLERLTEKGKFVKEYAVKALDLTPPDITEALRRDAQEAAQGSKVFYIAQPMPVNINVVRQASWVTSGDYDYGKFTLRVKRAQTLSINFSDFYLPGGTEMYIYNKDAEMITGPITEAENNEHKLWGSAILKGDELTIEIKIPSNEKERLGLTITNVAYGYKDIFVSKVSGFGQSGSCNINVLCPAGSSWANERNAVAYIASSDGQALCSGAMVMNTCGANIPYVLTADHCFQADNNVAGWRVHFQAWSPNCSPSSNSDGIMFNGATHRANWAASDFCLVRLNQTPPASSGIYYAGWSRSTTAATSGAGIHHPRGDVMKISTYNTTLAREYDPTRCSVNAVGTLHWVVQWNQGTTENGSSGSPLFDQNHRIVGQLSGGPASCSQPASCNMDMYGRFDDSWTGGGTNTTRLSNWLDPSNTGATTTNTTDISSLSGNNLSVSGPNSFCSNATYSVANLPAGATVNWTASPVGVVSLSPSGTSVNVTRIYNGTFNLSATVTYCGATFPAVTKNNITAGMTIYGSYSTSYDGGGPLIKYPQEGYNYIQPYSWVWANVSFSTGWSLVGGTISSWSYDGYNLSFYLSPGDWATFRVTVNHDGCTTTQDFTFVAQSMLLYRLAPNPADADLTLSVDEEKLRSQRIISSSDQDIQRVEIVDRFGKIVRQQIYPQRTRKATISTSGLITGMYVVRIFDGKNWSTMKFMKQ